MTRKMTMEMREALLSVASGSATTAPLTQALDTGTSASLRAPLRAQAELSASTSASTSVAIDRQSNGAAKVIAECTTARKQALTNRDTFNSNRAWD